jgi:hypothetical protein
MVPTEELPPGIPFTCQVTAGFGAFCTVTRNCTLAPAEICAEGGETLTVTTGAGSKLLFVEVPPPAHDICWTTAMSASHPAAPRSLEREEGLRTGE